MFEGKIRIRVCGILIENQQILLLKHEGIGPEGHLWSFPGGGVEFGESVSQALVREFREETGLNVTIEDFLFVNEYKGPKHHAVELFFPVKRKSGDIELGLDPELNEQMLTDIRFFSTEELKSMKIDTLHSIFREINDIIDITKLRGYYNFDELLK